MLNRIRARFAALANRRRFEEGMSEELRFHLEAHAADLIRAGVTPQEAARRTRIEFGSVDAAKEDCRASQGLWVFDALLRYARHAVRPLTRKPGFAAAALAPFALCLGANLAIFAMVDGVLLRPLPFRDAGRLALLYKTYPKVGVDRDGASPANYYERRGRISAFDGLALLHADTAIVGDTGSTEREEVTSVSPGFFATLGVSLAMGREFTDEEMTYQTGRVVILTDAAWRERLQADPHAIGRRIRMDGVQRTVVGVLPAGFRYLSLESRLYVPLASAAQERGPEQRHSGRGGELIARLKPGVSFEAAQAQIDALDSAVAHEYRQSKMISDAGYRTKVVPLHADHVASIRPTLLLLQTGVGFLLLIGCVNLVNLLLIRAAGRAKELAVRLAIGASRWHIASEVMAETTMLTVFGGMLGLAVGASGIHILAAFGAGKIPLGAQVEFDARLAAIALLASILIGVAVSLPIAWFNLRGQAGGALQAETRGGTAGRAAQSLRHGFIVVQIAFAFVLLAGAGLLSLSLEKASSLSLGFSPDHLLSGQISLPWDRYSKTQARLAFAAKLLEEIGHQPGVQSAGIATKIPLNGRNGKSGIRLVNRPLKPGELPRVPYVYGIDGGYFAAMRLPLREGRFLTPDDSRRPERTCVIDEILARHFWPQGGALGQRLFQGSRLEKNVDEYTIVGVVGAAKQAGVTESDSQGAVYMPFGHRSEGNVYLVARTAQAPESLGLALQRIVRAIDPELPAYDVRSMETRLADSLVTRKAPAILAIIFAGVALLLAAVGTYGVLSYAVAQRRREIGVRMALGAQPNEIRRQFFSIGLRLLTAGIALGLGGASLAGRAMQAILFDVPGLHLPTLAGAAGVMTAVALAACLLPSRRAARISPVEALSDR